jgi:hypothetical protein
MRHSLLQFLLVIGLIGSIRVSHPIKKQNSIEFRNVSVESQYPDRILFRIEICGGIPDSKVWFNYTAGMDPTEYWSWSRELYTLDNGQTSDNCDKRTFHLNAKRAEVPPFSPIRYFWSVTEGTAIRGKSSTYIYYRKDERFSWKSLKDEHLVVWWHDRSDLFGQDVMSIASRAFNDQAVFYASSLESPITIVITNTSQEFFAWQAEEDYAGGLAFPDISYTIQLVENEVGYYDWLNDVIPHEISHIYFNHLVKRYSGASDWLDEGLATYNEYSDHLADWNTVKSLNDLEHDFGEEPEQIDLAYSESYYAVLYMDEIYGKEAIATLLYEFSKGNGAPVAFEKAFGKHPDEFEQDFTRWLSERLKSPPPNTEVAEPIRDDTGTTQNDISTTQDSTDSSVRQPYFEILFIALLGLLLASLWLKPRRNLIQRNRKRRDQP